VVENFSIASASFALATVSPGIQRLVGTLQAIQTPSTRPPFREAADLSERIETLAQEIGSVERRIGIAETRLQGLGRLEESIGQAIADLTRIRDVELAPQLRSLTTNPTAAEFDAQRNRIDGLLDDIEPIDSSRLDDRPLARAALDAARSITDGSTGTIGDAEFYNFFLDPGTDPVVNPTIAPDIIANLDATDPASVLDTDTDGLANQVSDTAPADAVANDATQNGGREPTIVTGGAFGGAVGQALQFDGANDRLDIGGDGAEFDSIATDQRTFLVAFETGADVAATQVILDQSDNGTGGGGTVGEGFTLLVEGGRLKFIAAADNDSPGGQFNIAVEASVAANTGYVALLTLDQTSGTATITGRLNGAAFDIAPTATAGAGQRLADFDIANGGSAIGGSSGGVALDGGETAANGLEFSGVFGQATVVDRVLTPGEQADSEAFLLGKFGVGTAGSAFADQARADIEAARSTLTDSIAALSAELSAVSDAVQTTRTEIETLTQSVIDQVTAASTTSDPNRSPLYALSLQLGNPQAFGLFRPGNLADRSA